MASKNKKTKGTKQTKKNKPSNSVKKATIKKGTKTAAKKPAKSTLSKAAKNPSKKGAKKADTKKAEVKTSSAKKMKLATAKKTTAPKALKSLANAKVELQKSSQLDIKKIGQKFHPLEDRVACVIETQEKKTASGLLFIPDTVSTVEGYRSARVIDCGKGSRHKKGALRPLEIKVGDRVLLPQYAGTEVEIDGVKIILVREKELLGKQV
jgi:chaperonin GroES